MKTKLFYSTLLIFMLVLSACASATPTSAPVSTVAPVIPNTGQSTATLAPVATAMPATAMPVATAMPAATATMAPMATPTSPAAVNTSQNSSLGSFLVNSSGMTLYIFTKDTAGTSSAAAVSVCSGNCATLWPPLLTNGSPTAGTGVDASKLGTFTRSDGSTQVTYNGWPLYTYAKDMAAGDTNGEGVGSVWYVMTPAGMQK